MTIIFVQANEADEGESNGPTNREKAWAVVRSALGIAQVMAATTTLVFLVRTGTGTLTIVATILTLLLVVVSRMFFRREKQA